MSITPLHCKIQEGKEQTFSLAYPCIPSNQHNAWHIVIDFDIENKLLKYYEEILEDINFKFLGYIKPSCTRGKIEKSWLTTHTRTQKSFHLKYNNQQLFVTLYVTVSVLSTLHLLTHLSILIILSYRHYYYFPFTIRKRRHNKIKYFAQDQLILWSSGLELTQPRSRVHALNYYVTVTLEKYYGKILKLGKRLEEKFCNIFSRQRLNIHNI